MNDILQFADEANYKRICLYLLGNADYATEPDDTEILHVVLRIYRQLNKLPEALFIAMRIDEPELVQEIYESTEDRFVN